MRLAAIDVGTNTVRLLVADAEGEALTDVVRDRDITRLGKGVDADRRLDPEARERTVEVIARFVDRAKELEADGLRIAGTSVLRDATDRSEFVELVAERTGERLEILAGPDEGRLSLLGATTGLSKAAGYVVCDIGGGSTELTTGTGSVSLDIGSVRVKERFLTGEPPTTRQVSAARSFIDGELEGTTDLMIGGYETFVGVAGTITTLAALDAGLSSYDPAVVHGHVMLRPDVIKWTQRLLAMTPAEIVTLGPVEPGRADVIAGGVLILKRVMNRFLFQEVLVSEHDILDGLVRDLAARS